ncbi:BA75_01842T0 [Komagataella pastoris]|uniref:BA75_01842T0 n=1 Tax=Komagataella pastoris TaxID=4922 RepID=A0A1B2J8X4_PICPA|nr:BA75_01842T0 [Komagataella pastoris]
MLWITVSLTSPYDVTLSFAYAEYDSRSFTARATLFSIWPSEILLRLLSRHSCLLRTVTRSLMIILQERHMANFSSLTLNLPQVDIFYSPEGEKMREIGYIATE